MNINLIIALFFAVILIIYIFISFKQKGNKKVNNMQDTAIYHNYKYDIQNTMITGTTGSGKTQLLNRIINNRLSNMQARYIYFDLKGDYLQSYYKNGDVIIDITDQRGNLWNFLSEATDPAMIRQMAYLIIPENSNDSQPFFKNASRDILEQKLLKLWQEKRTDNKSLQSEIGKIEKDINKDVSSTYKQNIRPLSFINTTGDLFNLKEWLYNIDDKRNIFINYQLNYLDIQKPILSLFLSTFNNYILSKEFNNKQRINITIDELANLGKIDNLGTTLSLCREKNIGYLLATQNFKTLQAIYGDNFYNILDNCNNNYNFRTNEQETAQLISKSYGRKEETIILSSTNENSGSNNKSKGTSYAEHLRETDIIMPTEFLHLSDLSYYCRILTDNGVKIYKRTLNYIQPNIDQNIKTFILRADWGQTQAEQIIDTGNNTAVITTEINKIKDLDKEINIDNALDTIKNKMKIT